MARRKYTFKRRKIIIIIASTESSSCPEPRPQRTRRERVSVTATFGPRFFAYTICRLASRWHRKFRWKIDIYVFDGGGRWPVHTHIGTSSLVLFSSSLGYLLVVRWISSQQQSAPWQPFPERPNLLAECTEWRVRAKKKIEFIVWPFIFISPVDETKIERKNRGIFLVWCLFSAGINILINSSGFFASIFESHATSNCSSGAPLPFAHKISCLPQ